MEFVSRIADKISMQMAHQELAKDVLSIVLHAPQIFVLNVLLELFIVTEYAWRHVQLAIILCLQSVSLAKKNVLNVLLSLIAQIANLDTIWVIINAFKSVLQKPIHLMKLKIVKTAQNFAKNVKTK